MNIDIGEFIADVVKNVEAVNNVTHHVSVSFSGLF
jgi:hypothetical protein